MTGRSYALVIACACSIAAPQTTLLRQTSPTTTEQRSIEGSAAITGVVVDEATGLAIGGAVVTLEDRRSFAHPTQSKTQLSSPTGRFAFVDLKASQWYFVQASRSDYLDGAYGSRGLESVGAPIAIDDGQWVREVRVRLSKPGSINGRVQDEGGQPVVGVYVRALPTVLIAGRYQVVNGPAVKTDDRGNYRIGNLCPGRYMVSVPFVQAAIPTEVQVREPSASAGTALSDLNENYLAARTGKLLVDAGGGYMKVVGGYFVPPVASRDLRIAYGSTYYPSALTAEGSASIDLRASEDRFGIDILLQPVAMHRVSGRIEGDPEAVGGLLLRLVQADMPDLGQSGETATTMSLADGRFTFPTVPSGSYILSSRHSLTEFTYTTRPSLRTAVPPPVAFPARSGASITISGAPHGTAMSIVNDLSETPYWASVPIVVGGEDLDLVVVPLQRPGTMSGRLEWAADAAASVAPVLVLEPADGDRAQGAVVTQPTMSDARDFRFSGLIPGRYFLRIAFFGRDFLAIEAVLSEGRNYAEQPLEIQRGQNLTNVIVRLTSKNSMVRGVVTDGSGAVIAGTRVIAFPVAVEQRSNYGLNPQRLRSAFASTNGGFEISGLPVGDYQVAAVEGVEDTSWRDPQLLDGWTARSARIRIDRVDTVISGLRLVIINK